LGHGEGCQGWLVVLVVVVILGEAADGEDIEGRLDCESEGIVEC